MSHELAQIQEHLGYTFRDADLLRTALTHSSCLNESDEAVADNQRLEYLGDAVVDMLVADVLYRSFPQAQEGDLTRWRARLVSTTGLAELARQLDLGAHLILGRGEETTGGRAKPANLAAALEAVVAALYLDGGWDAVERAILPLFRPYIQRVTALAGPADARSRLQEQVQAVLGVTPRYEEAGESGPDHRRQFVVQVLVGDEVWGRGVGNSKRSAAQGAAEQALTRLRSAFG